MAKIFPIFKKVTVVGGGAANVIVNQRPAIQLTNIIGVPRQDLSAALALDISRQQVRVEQKPALTLVSSASGTPARSDLNSGISVQPRPTGRVEQLTGPNLTQVRYTLASRKAADGSADISGTWTNRANAQGAPNESYATSSGALTAGSRKMRLDFPNHFNKSELTITNVSIDIYIRKTLDPTAALGSVRLTYDVGAGEVLLDELSADFDQLVTPFSFNIFAGLNDWTKYDAFQLFIEHIWTNISATVTVSLDAAELVVAANRTELI